MSWFTGSILYVLIWWTALFVVLPFGVRPIVDPDDATGWRGAPARPRLVLKAAATTILAAVIWVCLYLVITSDWLSFRHGWLAMPPD